MAWSKIWNKCPRCGATTKGWDLFCTNCGNPLTKKCEKCGNSWRYYIENKFCPRCGTEVKPVSLT